ncbi:DUF3899 domain-containing protein [Sporosarcina sp. NPDC096371]|uniref:DUF3899 domain-containing protein n=1 Tax=Sporosarcina sp. NPDC096371 TaxID=3364530 RepID=UPI0038028C51
MSILKNKWFILILNFCLSLMLFFIFASQYNLVHFINILFYVSSVYLIVFLILFIANGRFFDGVTFSFRRFRRSMSKQKDHLHEVEVQRLPSEMINKSFYRFTLFQGISLLIILIILLIIYYS